VPGDDVEGGEVLLPLEEAALVLGDHGEVAGPLLEGGNGDLKVPRGCEAVGSDRAQVRQLIVAVEDLADVATARPAGKADRKEDAALDNADVVRGDLQVAELGLDVEGAELRDDEEVAIRVVEGPVLHVAVGGVDVDGNTIPRLRGASPADGGEPLHKVDGLVLGREVKGAPPELVWGWLVLLKVVGQESLVDLGVGGMAN